MCDSFAALARVTKAGNVLLAKNADTEINEAQHLLKLPRRRHPEGAQVRLSHRLVPQARETHEVILDKSFWSWGGEIGVNEHGVAVGNEAVWSNQGVERDGVMVIDMLRLILERARDCDEAIAVVGEALREFGQGGNCELTGNNHFDGSFLVSDRAHAVVIETAGSDWAAKWVADVGSISNAYGIADDWDESSLHDGGGKRDFRATFGEDGPSEMVAAPQRQSTSYGYLADRRGEITVRTMADLLRHVDDPDYHPARDSLPRQICMHAAPFKDRFWQATGSLISDSRPAGVMAWVTATSGPDVSIFKPAFFGVDLPDLGPMPREADTPGAYWWRHERLHRRAMADYRTIVPDLRSAIEELEDGFFAEAEGVLAGGAREKADFVADCWRRADELTASWTAKLERRAYAVEPAAYREMWERFNAAASLELS